MTAGVNHSFSEPDLLRLFSKYRYTGVVLGIRLIARLTH